MTGWPDRPVIYELNTAAWLYDVGKRAGKKSQLEGRVARVSGTA